MNVQRVSKMAAWCGIWLMQSALADGSVGTGSTNTQVCVAEKSERPFFEVAFDFCTRQLTYGLVDNREPVMAAKAAVAWHGLTFDCTMIFDTTKWGEKHGGYGNRKGTYQELAFGPGYACAVSPDDFALLPTTVELFVNHIYEYHPRVNARNGEENPDTRFVNAGMALPDLWLAPILAAEFDIDNECGAVYVLGDVGHTFALVKAAEGRETDPLSLTLCAGVGLGNAKRNRYDAAFDAWAFKDIHCSVSLDWNVTDRLAVSPYVAVYEQLHRRLREAARTYIDGEEHASTQVVGGLALNACF